MASSYFNSDNYKKPETGVVPKSGQYGGPLRESRALNHDYNSSEYSESDYYGSKYGNPNPMYDLGSNAFPYINRIASYKYDPEAQLIRGTMSFSSQKLSELDPSYTGFTHIFVLRIPPIILNPAFGWQLSGFDGDKQQEIAKAHCRNLKVLLEMGCTSYSGTPDLTLNSSQVAVGWAERAYPAPTYSAYEGTAFTLRCLEVRGDLLRKGIEYYTQGVADPNLKLATLNGALDGPNGELLEPTLPNMTWSFMIVQTDQTMLNIQDVSLWQNVVINGIDRSTLDWTNGEIDIVAPRDVNCTGVYVPDQNNPIINAWASKLLGTRMRYYKRYKDMTEQDLNTKEWRTWSDTTYSDNGIKASPDDDASIIL